MTPPTPVAAAPTIRWSSRARSIGAIEGQLARIWAQPDLTTDVDGDGVADRHIAARTSVMNLVVITRRPEIGEHCAATISQLTGRHPSRTLVVNSADADGPSWVDARIQALCVLPREGSAEVCAEFIYLAAGGESGRHLHAIVAPLLIHDLPVTVWWPSDPAFGTDAANDLIELADRLVVDGSTWSGDGLRRLRLMARLLDRESLAITDFALTRQSRWREAIASIFDLDDFRPFLRRIRRVSVTFATHDESGAPGTANVVKPIYHIGWLASRLGWEVVRPLGEVASRAQGATRPGRRPTGAVPVAASRGLSGQLRGPSGDVHVFVRPIVAPQPAGTTLRVEILAERSGSELRVDVTAEAETVTVHAFQDGVEVLDRRFTARRRAEAELLADAIEAVGIDRVSRGAIRMSAALAAPADAEEDDR
jgi:hypothetical protein